MSPPPPSIKLLQNVRRFILAFLPRRHDKGRHEGWYTALALYYYVLLFGNFIALENNNSMASNAAP
jgi:hypothetical protein